MLGSNAVEFTYNDQPAEMIVMRNSGHCWGRIEQGAEQFDVFIDEDLYDYCDEDAAEALIEAAMDPAKVHPCSTATRESERS